MLNKNKLTAGCSDSGCGCTTHKDVFRYSREKRNILNIGSSSCGCGCFSHTEILMA